jgi:hypothetical protein
MRRYRDAMVKRVTVRMGSSVSSVRWDAGL